MAKIACLGWGSLVWDQRDLRVDSQWFDDGPNVCVEFARQSLDGRITLVMVEGVSPVQSCWILMGTDSLSSALANLAQREGISEKNVRRDVGSWSVGASEPDTIPGLVQWAASRDIDHVIWTALPPKFQGGKVTPTAEAVVTYLRQLEGESRTRAENYIRSAPKKIRTVYRDRIERELQWTPEEPHFIQ